MEEGPGGLGGQRRKGENERYILSLFGVHVMRQQFENECYTATERTRMTLVCKCTPYPLSSNVAGVLDLSDD